MPQEWIFYPVIVMVVLTLVVGLMMLKLRYQAVREGNLSVAYFKLNRGGKEPETLAKVTQHFDYLFEIPILFYVIATLIYVTGRVDTVLLSMAWIFVIFRLAHAWVHMTYNNVLHRKNVFLISTVVMYSMWFTWLRQVMM